MDNNSKELDSLKRSTGDVFKNTLESLLHGLTGIALSNRSDVVLSISSIFQKMRGGQFLSNISNEWERYKQKDKIKDDYQFSEQHKSCLQELLEFLDKDSPNELRFRIIKQIFLVASTEEISDRDSVLPLQFMKIARSLTDGEIILISAVWNFAKNHEGSYDEHYSANRWLEDMKQPTGLKYKILLEIHERGLIEKRLISRRTNADQSGVQVNPNFRLTDLGYDFCQYISRYED